MSTEQATETKELDQYECRACGYVYEPAKGDSKANIAPATPFEELPNNWRCPVCGAKANQFQNIGPAGTASGFKENFGYGLGFNTMTSTQKSIVIFGALGLAILFFLSLYGLN